MFWSMQIIELRFLIAQEHFLEALEVMDLVVINGNIQGNFTIFNDRSLFSRLCKFRNRVLKLSLTGQCIASGFTSCTRPSFELLLIVTMFLSDITNNVISNTMRQQI